MEASNGQHEDLALKAAIQRVWGSEVAPEALRQRLQDVLGREVILRLRPTVWQTWQSRAYGMAAAAVLLLGVGLLALEARGVLAPQSRPATVASVPSTLSSSLLRAHDRSIRGESGYALDVKADPQAVRRQLEARLGVPMSQPILNDGWQLSSAGECRVGGELAAHLYYTRGGQSLSVFAVPLKSLRVPMEAQHFVDIVHGRPMTGTVSGSAVYCVVGSGEPRMQVQDIVAVRKRVLQSVFPR